MTTLAAYEGRQIYKLFLVWIAVNGEDPRSLQGSCQINPLEDLPFTHLG
jgi:hypothetical protein